MRRKNVKELKKLVETRILLQKQRLTLERFLISKGVAPFLVEEMLPCQSDVSTIDETLLNLKSKMTSKVHTSSGFHFSNEGPKMVAIIGGNGVGKTTSCLKILNFYAKEKKVGIVGLDREDETMERFSKSWNFPFAKDKNDLPDNLDLILIDTPGCSFYDCKNIAHLEKRFARFENLEIHLVLSAASKEVDLYGALHQFSALDIKSLIFTKLDETLTPGVLLNVSSKVDFPISFIAYDFPLPGKVEMATPELIVHKILTDFNSEMFHFLRQMAHTT